MDACVCACLHGCMHVCMCVQIGRARENERETVGGGYCVGWIKQMTTIVCGWGLYIAMVYNNVVYRAVVAQHIMFSWWYPLACVQHRVLQMLTWLHIQLVQVCLSVHVCVTVNVRVCSQYHDPCNRYIECLPETRCTCYRDRNTVNTHIH